MRRVLLLLVVMVVMVAWLSLFIVINLKRRLRSLCARYPSNTP